MKRLLAAILCLCLFLCGCQPSSQDPYVPTGNGLTYDDNYTGPQITPTTPENQVSLSLPYYKEKTLNPYTSGDFTNRTLFSLLYQSLFVITPSYTAEPQLCKSYVVSKDMKQWTFYLEEATFSDGSPVTAVDVVASLQAAWRGTFYSGRFLHVLDVTISQSGGVTVVTDTPYENLPILLDIPIVPASQVESDRPLGSGPYYLYTASGGESLRKRQNWWCKAKLAVTAEAISLFPAQSTTHIRDEFEFSDLSMACTDPGSDRYADYRCDFELWDCENGIFLYLATCADSTVFQNEALRSALTYAIDRDLLVQEFYRGFARSATLPASPASPYYNQTLAQRYQHDQEKFRQAVLDSGMDGSQIIFLVNTDDSLRLRVARRIAGMLREGGLIVTMKELSGDAYLQAMKARQFDIYLGQTRLSPNMDLTAFFHTYGELSWGGVNNVGAYTLSLQALENHGNYYTLHKRVMDKGLLCPILFRSYAIYAARGAMSSITPARDNVFYYSLGKTLEQAKTTAVN